MIPMINLKKQLENIRTEIDAAVSEVVESTHYVLGSKVKEFEEKVAGYMGVDEAIGVASGTDALHLALKVNGIKDGDEVITTPFTFFATIETILYERAKPVFVDIETDTFNIDVSKIEKAVNEKTRAIVPVHIFGHPVDMKAINEIAQKHNLKVIEDCAQSFGASLDGTKTGSFGDAGCFSFYPSKNLGGYGDGGLVTVKDRSMAAMIRKLRNHGSAGNYLHDEVGINSRLDEIQAAILLVKFKRIDEYNETRRQKASLYSRLLSGKVRCPVEHQGYNHVYHQYTILNPRRDEIKKKLEESGISSTIYYPVPMHLQPALKYLGYREGDFPMAEKAAREVLSLPICPEIEDDTVQYIAETILGA